MRRTQWSRSRSQGTDTTRETWGHLCQWGEPSGMRRTEWGGRRSQTVIARPHHLPTRCGLFTRTTRIRRRSATSTGIATSIATRIAVGRGRCCCGQRRSRVPIARSSLPAAARRRRPDMPWAAQTLQSLPLTSPRPAWSIRTSCRKNTSSTPYASSTRASGCSGARADLRPYHLHGRSASNAASRGVRVIESTTIYTDLAGS